MTRIRLIGRHWPKTGVWLFFDVKTIAVNAFGGRRYTGDTQLILPWPQKRRGKFYLVAADAAHSGRTRWAYVCSQGSESVCRFMRQVRRWYPAQPIWRPSIKTERIRANVERQSK